MSRFHSRSKQKAASEIDVAPMMDMVFILLIFFIVTSTFTRETGVDVNKPDATTASILEREAIMVGLSREGTIHIHETQVSLDGLGRILINTVKDTPERPVIIVADRDAPGGMIVDILDECNLAKIVKVSISATQN
jgi:biopolymer transport protein ExbD